MCVHICVCAQPSPTSNYNYALRCLHNKTQSPATSDVLKDKKGKVEVEGKVLIRDISRILILGMFFLCMTYFSH